MVFLTSSKIRSTTEIQELYKETKNNKKSRKQDRESRNQDILFVKLKKMNHAKKEIEE